ncbi:MAG: hypothetical protein V5804_15675 [Mucilaginibacter sp.]|uniref:hypothetical protein n=1 Tax=Mucilaginibacter sp. TaxID=1882438 RepID=UPI0034E58895
MKGVIDTAFGDGKMEGKQEGEMEGRSKEKLEIAKALKANGISIEIIAKTTGLSADEIENL